MWEADLEEDKKYLARNKPPYLLGLQEIGSCHSLGKGRVTFMCHFSLGVTLYYPVLVRICTTSMFTHWMRATQIAEGLPQGLRKILKVTELFMVLS
jgi:hypothetical protein